MRSGFVRCLVVVEAVGLPIALAGLALWLLSLARYSKIAGRRVQRVFGPGAVRALATFALVLSSIELAVVLLVR